MHTIKFENTMLHRREKNKRTNKDIWKKKENKTELKTNFLLLFSGVTAVAALVQTNNAKLTSTSSTVPKNTLLFLYVT